MPNLFRRHILAILLLLPLVLSAYQPASLRFSVETKAEAANVQASPPSLAPLFKDVTDQAGIRATHRGIWRDYATGPYDNGYLAVGSAWGDYNNDGWVDLFVTGNLDPNVLYLNSQDGAFQIAPQSMLLSLPEIPSGGAVWADFDNDGWRDLYVLNMGPNRLFRNIQGERFEDNTIKAGVGDAGKGTTAAWGDYDRDGFLDLYVTNWTCHPECDPLDVSLSQDVLYHNNGDGTFSDVSHFLIYEKLLGSGFSASFIDIDNDGDLDIYVVNDKVSNAIGNILWRNDGAGCQGWCWTDVAEQAGAGLVVHGMGLASGDYNNDGDLDLYFSNMVRAMVLLDNQGDGTFIDATAAAGVGYDTGLTVGWGTAFFDYDNDGWLDLYQATTGISPVYGATGMLFPFDDQLYHNKKGQSFEPVEMAVAEEPPRPGMGFSVADYDNDGYVDFLVGNWNEGFRLYHNEGRQTAKNHWLTIQLVGDKPINRDAIGARVVLRTTDGNSQMREVKSGSSIGSGNDTTLHFGLGQAAVSQVEVIWPNGETTTFHQAPSNQIWRIAYAKRSMYLGWTIIVGIAVTSIVAVVFGWVYRRRTSSLWPALAP